MKNRLKFPLFSILLVLLLFSPNAFPQDTQGTVVSVAPRPILGDIRDANNKLKTITVDIVIENGQNVAGYQVMLQFNGGFLEYDRIQQGDYLPKDAFFGTPKIIDIDATDPEKPLKAIFLAATSFTGENNGYGVLATLTFKVPEPSETEHKSPTAIASDLILLDNVVDSVSGLSKPGTVLSNKAGVLSYPTLENSKTFTVKEFRNLVIESIQAVPIDADEARNSYSKEEKFQLRATVRNKGNVESLSSKRLTFSGPATTETDEGDALGGANIEPISPHRSVEVSLPTIVTAPDETDTYYYTVCLGSDCSKIEIKVEELPDLVVESVSANKTTLAPGRTFTLTATLKNRGFGRAKAPIYYRWHRSTHANFQNMAASQRESTGANVEIGKTRKAKTWLERFGESVDVMLTPNQSIDQKITITAPEEPGTYYYHVCMESPHPEIDPNNNCSDDVIITVGRPDLVVESIEGPSGPVAPGETFTLTVDFKNKGTLPADPLIMFRYYRSANNTISATDILVGTGERETPLSEGTTHERTLKVTAPATPGTYYYGAYVKEVDDGIDTDKNWSDAVKVTVGHNSNQFSNDVPLELPKDLISEVAFGPNSTYFVLHPQFARVPEKDKNENYFFYKSTITLGIGDKQPISEESIENSDGLPAEYPYLMIPIDETPREKAATANEIKEGSIGDAFENSAEVLITGGALDVAGRLPIVGTFVGPISLAIDIISTFIGSQGDSNRIVTAMREELKEALTHPKMTIYNFSSFFPVQENSFQENSVKIVDRPILFMIPQRLTSIEVEIEQKFYKKNDRIPIQIVGELKPNSKDFWIWTLTLMPNPSKTFSDPIPLTPKGYNIKNTPSLLKLLEHADSDIHLYLNGSLRIESLGGSLNSNKDARTREELDNEYVVGVFIRNSLNDLRKALESAPKLRDLNVGELQGILYPMGVIRPSNRITYTIYTGYPSWTTHHNTWNLEETWQQQENNAPAAPRANLMSLADYPPFQQLPPEVQEYLLQHFEGTPNTEVTNVAAWQIPETTSLLPNYPNPFNPETWIPYQLAQPADVKLKIYDINGHVVRDLDLGHQTAGIYRNRKRAAHWDGKNAQGEPVASGVYFYTLTAGDFSATRKMLIRK